MKTNKFMQFMAAAVVVCGMLTMTSCEKDDYELPEVIESEVYESGVSSEVKSQSGTEGTQLSYESWIMVKGITRASFDNKVSVTLNNQLNNVDSVITVQSFELGEYTTDIDYQSIAQRTEGFVTVTDSVLVYQVIFDQFSFAYNLQFEVPVYNDGVTKQTMPYHRYGNIKDNGYTLEEMDFLVEASDNGMEYVYLRKLLSHSLTVEFNGCEYTLTAKIELRRNLGTAPRIVKSEVLEDGKDILQSGVFGALSEVHYQSWIKVKQFWSDGNVVEKTYTNRCAVEISLNTESKMYKILPDIEIIREKAATVTGETEETAFGSETEYIRSYVTHKSYEIKYNYFTLTYLFQDMVPVYDDNVTRHQMPNYQFDQISDSFHLSERADDYVNGNPAFGYIFYSKLSFKFGNIESSFDEDISLYVLK